MGLTEKEDAELRRLHFFRRFGVIADRAAQRYTELRSRDRRGFVRDPEEKIDPLTRPAPATQPAGKS
jgi:hypothetical protein